MNRIQILAAGSVAVGISVLALKYIAYVLTGSVALLSDAIESIVNLVTAVVALSPSAGARYRQTQGTLMATTRPNISPQWLKEP